jgi:hypothetical protein
MTKVSSRAISGEIKIGKNSANDRAVAAFTLFTEWNVGAVHGRASMLSDLAMRVWDVQAK